MTDTIFGQVKGLVDSLRYNELYTFSIHECNNYRYLHIYMNITESNFYIDIDSITAIKYDSAISLYMDTVNGYVFMKLDKPHIDIQL
jgi:hypothetical protein